ncbi:DUF6912 family protein [Knoellia subterranea]|uniref:Uncharacterized protein n=1 Tax=Knoellia subterranea KCTC 19937 TaxID=1385521 RepID=A0A0A0JIW3_9MICO|nr:hypothetical protein [Knoellia subterranea]KGN36998.1 hypothetical protein N803_16410 [Knoellia subterranea KCTC 19937]
MPLVRVFVPLDREGLAALRRSGELGPAPVAAHAAVAAAARPTIGNDEEEREYAAWSAAADDAASVVAQGDRRVVASADVDAAVVTRADEEGTAVEVGSAVPLPRIASFHVDEEPGSGIEDLLWYDITELDDVIALAHPTA